MSYPGGKAGSGVYQRLINSIPPHNCLVVPFAGHCGLTRHIRPAALTVLMDLDPAVCDWWKARATDRRLIIRNSDGLAWLSAADAGLWGAFVFLDPPYRREARRSSGPLYDFEFTDADHARLVSAVTANHAAGYQIMLCGFPDSYTLPGWHTFEHRVPTRRGIQLESVWMNYPPPLERLHDYRYIGNDRRSRERIRRRQRNWLGQLKRMSALERRAMLEILKGSIE